MLIRSEQTPASREVPFLPNKKVTMFFLLLVRSRCSVVVADTGVTRALLTFDSPVSVLFDPANSTAVVSLSPLASSDSVSLRNPDYPDMVWDVNS
jgi:hypothetical protein